MTIQKTKPVDPCKWLDDAPEKAKAWRNLYFYKNGSSHFGRGVHPTEAIACDLAGKEVQRQRDEQLDYYTVYELVNGKEFFINDFSHHIQLPVKGDA